MSGSFFHICRFF